MIGAWWCRWGDVIDLYHVKREGELSGEEHVLGEYVQGELSGSIKYKKERKVPPKIRCRLSLGQ